MKHTTRIVKICLLALVSGGFSSENFAQEQVSIVVKDSRGLTPMDGAVVLDLVTGQVAIADSVGYAEFPNTFISGSMLELCVSVQGYPISYYERLVPDFGPGLIGKTNYHIGVTPSGEYSSPLVGPAGGTKSFQHGTGELWDNGETQPISEYFQMVSATINPGALTSNYRANLSLIPDSANNNLHLDQLGDHQIAAQFRFDWEDESGLPASPIVLDPLRIEMTGGNSLFGTILKNGSWSASLYKFNDNTYSWEARPEGTSGLAADGTLWADITEAGEYSFMAWTSQLASGPCVNVLELVPWIGPNLESETIYCPRAPGTNHPNDPGYSGGTQSSQGIKDTKSYKRELTGSIEGKTGKLMGTLGLEISASVSGGVEWENTLERNASWAPNAWIGKSGVVSINETGFRLCTVLYCVDPETGGWDEGDIDEDGCSNPIITGITVNTDNLTDC